MQDNFNRMKESESAYSAIRYFDDAPISRSQDTSSMNFKNLRGILLPAYIVAAVILVTALYICVIAPISNKLTSSQNLSRDVLYETPILTSYATLSDEELLYTFGTNGYTILSLLSDDGSSGIDVFKVPSDMSIEEAQEILNKGIGNSTSIEASKILYGSWRFTTDRSSNVGMRIRYADFKSGSVDKALNEAMNYQGFKESDVTSKGTDDSGNTYCEGKITVSREDHSSDNYTFRVSALPLSDVYDVGLPDNAVYVGVRIDKTN